MGLYIARAWFPGVRRFGSGRSMTVAKLSPLSLSVCSNYEEALVRWSRANVGGSTFVKDIAMPHCKHYKATLEEGKLPLMEQANQRSVFPAFFRLLIVYSLGNCLPRSVITFHASE